jgi:hypothetical protein
MQGQWLGRFKDNDAEGMIVVDVDDVGSFFEGRAHLFYENMHYPTVQSYFRTQDRHTRQTVRATPLPLDPLGNVLNQTDLVAAYGDISFPTEPLDVHLEWDDRVLSLKWSDEAGGGQASCQRNHPENTSNLVSYPEVKNWKQFRDFVVELDHDRFVFRGQPARWRLRTSFHRTNRKDLVAFAIRDIPDLHKVLSAQTQHYFNLNDRLENAAFWHLLQHHGYPTPLLDWTRSPFVAAYFAFRRDPLRPPQQEFVRIAVFDRKSWVEDFRQVPFATGVRLHFSVLDPVVIGNGRALPQQATSFITNCDDIETYIKVRENERSKQYLYCFDLPVSEQEKVLRELSLMGVSPGSLFPGLDGACQEMKARHFGHSY